MVNLLFSGCEYRKGWLLGARQAEHLKDGIVHDRRLLVTQAQWRQMGLFVW